MFSLGYTVLAAPQVSAVRAHRIRVSPVTKGRGIAFRRNQSPGLLQMLRVAYQIIAVHQGTVLKDLKGMEQNWFFSEG